MKKYEYTSDIWGNESCDFSTLEEFEAFFAELHALNGWGEMPRLIDRNGEIYYMDGENRVVVGSCKSDFCPTHIIEMDGRFAALLLVEGVLYDRGEWESGGLADFEVSEEGEYLFHGQPFNGQVYEISSSKMDENDVREAVWCFLYGNQLTEACSQAEIDRYKAIVAELLEENPEIHRY